ncbi:MAG: LegC family aminotransferase, partial [bacterium]|nr:LegC family aminotransferase [bacterium]
EKFAPGALLPKEYIPLSVPEIRGNEWKYVKECLDSGWVSSVGSYVNQFEEAVAKVANTKYAVATVNGTSALHIALILAGVEANDEVIVSDMTFIAPVFTIRYTGAYPVFIDAEPNYYQMDGNKLQHFLEKECVWKNGFLINKTTKRKVKAIIPVHILGHPVEIQPIVELSKKYNLFVIEDATESIGAKYKNQPTGSFGDIGCFSFNGNKLITTGGGGMLVTNEKPLADRARYLTTQAKDDPLEYIHGAVGYNYRLTNVLSAIGLAQVELLEEFIQKKIQIAQRYEIGLGNVNGITTMKSADWAFSTYWLYTILIDEKKFGRSSRELLHILENHKIQARPLWQPMHKSPVFQNLTHQVCPVSAYLNQVALSIPCSVGLTEENQQIVIDTIRNAAKC